MKNLKYAFIALVVVLSVLILCGCGNKSENVPEATPSAVLDTSEAVPEKTEEPEPVVAEAPKAEPAEDEDEEDEEDEDDEDDAPFNEMKALAETFLEKDVSVLIEAIGEPKSSDYAPSCLGPGEDGELNYDGFTVYTYKEGLSETVIEVV